MTRPRTESRSLTCGPPRTLWRTLRVVEHLGTGALILAAVGLASRPQARPAWLPGVVQWWFGRLCRALGVQVRAQGGPASGALLVGNHISWLDVLALGAQGRIGFLSKSEVRRWPLIGWMSAMIGTPFIDRGAHRTDAVIARLAERIAAGESLMIFPEGTTTDGDGVLPFYPRLFAIAQRPGTKVQPVALAYRCGRTGGPDGRVAYVGSQTLLASLWQVLRHPGLVAEVRFLAPVPVSAGTDRRSLATGARAAILAALGLPERPPTVNRARPRPRPRVGLGGDLAVETH